MGVRKTSFIREVIRDMQLLAEMRKRWSNQINEWQDNGYAAGGSDQITDTDVAGADITAAQLASCINLIENFEKLATNIAPTTGDYAATLNAVYRAEV